MSFIKFLMEQVPPAPDTLKKTVGDNLDWRERRVWHVSRTGQRNFVKIKSLTPDEQERYKPVELKAKDVHASKQGKKKRGRKRKSEMMKMIMGLKNPESTDTAPANIPVPEQKPEVTELLDFYYVSDDEHDIEKIKEGQLVKATLDSAKALELEDDGMNVISVKNVPVEAVKEYMDDNGDWKDVPNKSPEELKEFLTFQESSMFKLDLSKFLDIITMDVEGEDEDENETDEETKEESVELKDYEIYMVEKELTELLKLGLLENYLIKEDELDPELVSWAKNIAKKLGLYFNGYQEGFGPHPGGLVFTDKVTDSSIMVNLGKTLKDTFLNAYHHLVHHREKWNKPVPSPELAEI